MRAHSELYVLEDELVTAYNKTIREARTALKEGMLNILKNYDLDGLVRRKRDGRVGRLGINDYNLGRYYYSFYPITKSGEPSKLANGYVGDIGLEFEPYHDNNGEE